MKRVILLAVALSVGCAVAGWRGRFDEQFAASVAEAEWTPADLNPMAWFQGENNAVDSAGAYDGTWTGTAAYTNGAIGAAFSYTGGNMTRYNDMEISNAVTLCFWMYHAKPSGIYFIAVKKGGNSISAHSGFFAGFDAGSTTRFASLQVYDGTVGCIKWSAGVPGNRDRWIHVAYTVALGGSLHIYIDGDRNRTHSLSEFSGSMDNTLPFIIGGTIGAGPLELDAFIDDVLIFDRALTPDEIKKLYDESVKRNGRAWK